MERQEGGDTMSILGEFVYRFGNGTADGDGSMKGLLGGKGAGLAEMTTMSIPVPPGFTITTAACRYYLEHGTLPDGLRENVMDAMHWLERASGHSFGAANDPLLVSVRSGAPVSMPGMMDTILNIGLNDECMEDLWFERDPEFALDSYCRLLQMFGAVVMAIPKGELAQAAQCLGPTVEAFAESADKVAYLRRKIGDLKGTILRFSGCAFPQQAEEQLFLAIESVFQSWQSERARCYRKLNGIAEDMGTAVTVQAMIFGNRGEESGTGVGFTRNPSTGAKEVFGEFLSNAQGEDIVAGVRTPEPIAVLAHSMPVVYKQLVDTTTRLERHFRDVQDFEFTVEAGRLFLLQTRSAKRAPIAAVRIAVDMVEEGLISKKEAVARVEPSSLTDIFLAQFDLPEGLDPITCGLAASPGAAVGRIALSSTEAVDTARSGEPTILVTEETTADDIQGMAVSVGFLTAHGGATSHAAVVARGMGKCCITGATRILIEHRTRSVEIGGVPFNAGDWLSMDGSSGLVYPGKLPLTPATSDDPSLEKLLTWALESSSCIVRANADTPADAQSARTKRAEGIGLCRTEHMFFAPGRLECMRAMILATDESIRMRTLRALLPMQQSDFEELFRIMSPFPVTIRLLDPPLHEFLPSPDEYRAEIQAARKEEDWETCCQLEVLSQRAAFLSESNPMMGHRGCRLSLTHPELLRMQVRAILQAALKVAGEGISSRPEIMVPLIASEQEMEVLAAMINVTATEVFAEHGSSIEFRIGTMIELPRAAICAAAIAKHVSFISFGTNDLTQMTYGFSRDDAHHYLKGYLERGLLKSDPFVTIDRDGVGFLIKMAVHEARTANPQIKIGVCGEHGGDPDSIRFFRSVGVDYVSCSPARLPIAQIAAAQSFP
jgi:pyruvate,orthophosphate dikinase